MKAMYQIIINNKATKFVFTDKLELINKMIELQGSFNSQAITFIIINL